MTAKCSPFITPTSMARGVTVHGDVDGGLEVDRDVEVLGEQVGRTGRQDAERHMVEPVTDDRVDGPADGAVPAPHQHTIDAVVDHLADLVGGVLALRHFAPRGCHETGGLEKVTQLAETPTEHLVAMCDHAHLCHADPCRHGTSVRCVRGLVPVFSLIPAGRNPAGISFRRFPRVVMVKHQRTPACSGFPGWASPRLVVSRFDVSWFDCFQRSRITHRRVAEALEATTEDHGDDEEP